MMQLTKFAQNRESFVRKLRFVEILAPLSLGPAQQLKGAFAVSSRAIQTFPAFLLQFAMVVALTSGTLMTISVQAADEVVTFENPAHKQMYQVLLKEYRCLKCQNQNLWDSNASLAGDLRREIRGQIIAGNSKADIDEYLVTRYGEFVLYRPRFSSKTAILWIGPFVLLLIGLTSLVIMVRRKSKSTEGERPDGRAAAAVALHSEDQLDKARAILKD